MGSCFAVWRRKQGEAEQPGPEGAACGTLWASPLPRAALRALALAATVVLGLATRKAPGSFPPLVAEYGGDTLYATLWVQLIGAAVYLWTAREAAGLVRWRVASPGQATRIAACALIICTAVEFSQALDTPWLNAIRATTAGSLVLGRGFLASDLVCYVVGSLFGLGLEVGLRWRS